MSIYTTPLQFGYFLSFLLFLVFFFRSYYREMMSDRLLAFLMLIFALELQDYTFGFSGINVLWEQLSGFPRGVALLFGPIMYFYLKAQVNLDWRFEAKDYWHFAPWTIGFTVNLLIFLLGPEWVMAWQESSFYYYLGFPALLARWLSYGYYFYHSLRLYDSYRKWIDQSFSDIESISLSWFRNFIYLMLFWISFRELMKVLDYFLDLSFYQDWWWNLALVAVSVYVGLSGMTQKEASNLAYTTKESENSEPSLGRSEKYLAELEEVDCLLDKVMEEERLFLQSQLNLKDLAKQLRRPSALLSAAINLKKECNFNDYINSLRIKEFLSLAQKDGSESYTLLSLAFDCGFNSKATFNRAFKKEKGLSPREYLNTIKKDQSSPSKISSI
jgi:AraC-like DNA-binding protein